MKETDFIGQNKEKWSEFEKVLEEPQKDPDKLGRLFIETTDDLSFSRTYYANRSVRVYLNGVAQQIYQSIYKKRRTRKGAFVRFWKEELPDTMWYARKQLWTTLIIFILGLGIGAISMAYDSDFFLQLFGQGYLDETLSNIEEGNALGIYGNQEQFQMFFEITSNNINVSVLCFFLGILAGIGSLYVIISNAISVGCFFMFFIQRGLIEDAFYTVLLHGTIELSMIVLAGTAGLLLGRGLMFPGSYSRVQSFMIHARMGMRIMISVALFLVVAGFIESFATRYTEVSNVLRGFVIFLSFAIVVGYFFIYPYYRHLQGLVKEPETNTLVNEEHEKIALDEIKGSQKIIDQSWQVIAASIGKLLICGFIAAIISSALLIFSAKDEINNFFDYGTFEYYTIFDQYLSALWFWPTLNNFFDYDLNPLFFPAQVIALALCFLIVLRCIQKKISSPNKSFKNIITLTSINCIICATLMLGIFFTPIWANVLIGIFIWPFLLLTLSISFQEGVLFFPGMLITVKLLKNKWFEMFKIFSAFVLVIWICVALFNAPIVYLLFEMIGSQFAASLTWTDNLVYILYTFLAFLLIGFLFPTLLVCQTLLYFDLKEISHATELKSRIEKISFKKRAYGLEKEV